MNTAQQSGVNRRDFRRIGRKMLSSGRTLALIEARVPQPQKRRLPSYHFRRWHAAVPLAIILVVGGVLGAQAFMHAQAEAKQKAAAAAANAHARSVQSKAETCRQQKVQEKSAAIGTLTYDQLYDNGACDF